MKPIQESFSNFFGQVINAAPSIIAGIIALLIFITLGYLASKAIKKFIGSRATSLKKLRLVLRLIRWAFYTIGLVIALNIMGLTEAASGVLAAGGVLTVVLGFAFREIGENLLAGLFMSFSRSFDVGDLIESNNIRGVVKKIEIRDVHVRTVEGSDIFIPSGMIFKNPLINFTRDGLRRTTFSIGIDYRNNLKEAQQLLLLAANETEGVLRSPATIISVAEFSDNYMKLQVHFWINTLSKNADLNEIQNAVMNNCHHALAENGFTFSSEVSTSIEMLDNKTAV